jgi:hypothetical protein
MKTAKGAMRATAALVGKGMVGGIDAAARIVDGAIVRPSPGPFPRVGTGVITRSARRP